MKQILLVALCCTFPFSAYASDLNMSLQVKGNAKPILNIRTNLPPKSVLTVSVANPINRGGDGYFAQAKGEVGKNQIAQIGPFTKNGESLTSGTYQVTVMVMPSLQSEGAKAVLGEHGEKLTGPHVIELPGTADRYFAATFTVAIESQSSTFNPTSDEHRVGTADEKWQRVPVAGPELYIKTDGRYFTANPPLSTAKNHLGYGFATYIVSNLPKSTTVGAPQSVMLELEGNCETRHYSLLGSLFFAKKNRSGMAMENLPAENIEKTLVPNSPIEKAFDMLCAIAREQK